MMPRHDLGALLLAMVLAAGCSPAQADSGLAGQRRDSPPPQPMPPPQVVAATPADKLPNASNLAAHFSLPTQQFLTTMRERARREWRKDANVTSIRYKWSPTDASARFWWIEVRVASPSDGALRDYSFGAPYDGTVHDWAPFSASDSMKTAVSDAIPDIKFGVKEAMAAMWNVGLHDTFTSLELQIVGSKGHPKVPAWRVMGMQSVGGMGVPTVNALTGGFMDWRLAYNTPGASDAEIKAVWDQLLGRNKPPRNLAYEKYGCELRGGNWMPWDVCDR